MAMSFTWLRTFHAVAAHRGFTSAAKALGIGQPTVTLAEFTSQPLVTVSSVSPKAHDLRSRLAGGRSG